MYSTFYPTPASYKLWVCMCEYECVCVCSLTLVATTLFLFFMQNKEKFHFGDFLFYVLEIWWNILWRHFNADGTLLVHSLCNINISNSLTRSLHLCLSLSLTTSSHSFFASLSFILHCIIHWKHFAYVKSSSSSSHGNNQMAITLIKKLTETIFIHLNFLEKH